MSQSKNIKRWIDRINGSPNSDSAVIDALLKVRPYSKRKSGIQDIEQQGGVQCLLALIQRPNKRVLDISISILANCLTENVIRKKVFKCQGIPYIVKLLQTIKCYTILTRSCRSIANLANDVECSKTIHAIGAVDLIIKLMKQSATPEECVASALRALRNLANTPGHRRKLIQHGVVAAITKCFDTDSKEILSSALRSLAAVSQSCTLEFADHMLANDGDPIRRLVKIIKDDTTSEGVNKKNALSVMINLTLQGCTRPTVGSVGGLGCIVDEIRKMVSISAELTAISEAVHGPLQENAFSLVGALCYCCREAINRARLRSMDALPIFIQLLSDNRWIHIHLFILTTMLCFVYDEEGLKILHENGIFSILLQKLQEYVKQEKGIFKDSKRRVWDGNDLESDEKFDKRQSLSYDVATRFNQRPLLDDPPTDIEATFKVLRKFDFDWKTENLAPYSPQWSPMGPSPVPDEIAFAAEPTQSTSQSLSPLEPNINHSHAAENNDLVSDLLLEQDDSSSSREGFDQMHSPALLPVVGNLRNNNGEDLNSVKRERTSSSDSNNDGGEDFPIRMERDLRQVPKRAKFDNLKESGERIRSRSLDHAGNSKNVDARASSHKGSNSPKPEYTLPNAGNTLCSPSFLQFVNETCSFSPLLLKQAGRDAGSLPGSSTSASVWRQTKRRRVSGASKKLDDEVTDLTVEQKQIQAKPIFSELKTPELSKTSSNPLPLSNEEKPDSSAKDCALSGPEPVTPVQVILCLLCHYCEMSDTYVVSLAQQEHCTTALVAYLTDSPRNLDQKFHRIIDRLTSCPECFRRIVTSFLVPRITAASSMKMISGLEASDKPDISCQYCPLSPTSSYVSLLDNMWHNVSLIHSSIYGFSMLKGLLKTGTSTETIASTCIVLLLSLWCKESETRMKNLSDSFLKRLASNLQMMADENKIHVLCDVILNNALTSNAFKCASYAFHKLVTTGYKPIESSGDDHDSDVHKELKTDGQSHQSKDLLTLFATQNTETINMCEYDKHCDAVEPDKIFVFPMETSEHHEVNSMKRRKRNRRQKAKAKSPCIPIHADIVSTKSPMFEAMLGGKYRESSEKKVTIQEVPYETALYIIHEMYGCEECPKMKSLLSESSRSHTSRYQMFCDAQIQTTTLKGCPAETDILRVMDLWLLQDSRRALYDRRRIHFKACYIEPEISSLARELKPCTENYFDLAAPNLSLKEDDCEAQSTSVVLSTRTPHSSSSKCPFLNFLINHGFVDVTQDYLVCFFSPCLCDHNHILQGKVLTSIYDSLDDKASFQNLLVEKICKILEDFVNEFKIVRKPT